MSTIRDATDWAEYVREVMADLHPEVELDVQPGTTRNVATVQHHKTGQSILLATDGVGEMTIVITAPAPLAFSPMTLILAGFGIATYPVEPDLPVATPGVVSR